MNIQFYEYRDRFVLVEFPSGAIMIHLMDQDNPPNKVGRLLHTTLIGMQNACE